MKRNKLSMLGAGFAMALAGLMGSAQASQSYVNNNTRVNHEVKATAATEAKAKRSRTDNIGGVPLTSILPDYGMSPKEYGQKFGHGNGKGKSNRLRLSHNAKLKRR